MVLIGPHDDAGWSQAHYEGLQYIEQNVDNSHVAYVEFVPEGGYVVLALTIDTGEYDQLLITEEPAMSQPTTPAEDWAWSSSLAA